MKLSLAFFSVILLLRVSTAYSAAPKLINYQGRLTTPGGSPVTDGVYTIRFRIYSDSTTATPLWEEIQPVSVASGLFAVMLGGITVLPDTLFNSANRFVGVKVNLDAELTPRSRLTSAAYALETSQWTNTGAGSAFRDGSIGIGTTPPIRKLDVFDNSGAYSSARFGTNNPEASLIELYNSGTSQHWQLGTAGPNGAFSGGVKPKSFYVYRPPMGYVPMVIDSNGHVGIDCTPNIGDALHVDAVSLPSPHTTVNGIFGTGAYNGSGVVGFGGSFGNSTGIYGIANNSSARAGLFSGNVDVLGTLTKYAGSFKIDHPLDPAHKYLEHSFVESPDMKNIYDGVIILDADGKATVTMPNWFEALNQDFRYQLTCIGGFAPIYIAQEISGNQFKIAGGNSGMKVSWQVTGIRHDAYAIAHRIPVEENKPLVEQGHYLQPELFGEPEEMSVEWARHPELMKQLKAEREKAARTGGEQ